MKQRDHKQGFTAENIFGDKATSANYSFRSKIRYFMPRDLRLSFSRQEMAASSALSILRHLHAGRAKGGQFSFQTEWLRVFQDGDPALDKMTIINCFDAQDREIQLWVYRNVAFAPNATSHNQITSECGIQFICLSPRYTPR
jgi:hypothetical protein